MLSKNIELYNFVLEIILQKKKKEEEREKSVIKYREQTRSQLYRERK